MSFYNFSAEFIDSDFPFPYRTGNAELVFTVDNNNLVTDVSGTIIVYQNGSIILTSNIITLYSPGSIDNNDNILDSVVTAPYFSVNGLALNYTYLGGGSDILRFLNVSGFDNSISSVTTSPLISESLSLACLLSNTNILTKNGYIRIDSLKNEDIIVSENKEFKIKKIMHTEVKLIDKYMPFLLPKDFLNSNEDLYLSQGHEIKVEGKFKLPEHLGLKRLSIEEFLELNENKYYHIELYCEEGEDRRTNTLDANGVIVESYSSKEIPW
uniref:Uncharacterized protein n=1 Tax=viral metagenome TaxID=1070528 RepID=A0A6C0AE72_9ZZZZ